jgi:hypothetical protein
VSRRDDWKTGDRLGRSKGEDMVVTAVIEPDDDLGPRAYLVVVPAETFRASEYGSGIRSFDRFDLCEKRLSAIGREGLRCPS